MRGHHFLPSQQDLDHTSAAAAKGGYQLSRVENQDLSALLALNSVIFTSCIQSPFTHWL